MQRFFESPGQKNSFATLYAFLLPNGIIEHDKHGYFAYVPELKGCHTQGNDLEEVMKNIQEATDLYWSTFRPAEIKRITNT